jgi:aminoglycoside phosphotransferase family enzyme/predicted kinase
MNDDLMRQHEALVSGLLDPAAYPHPVGRVERIETHISTVLLAGEFAYKLKKPVDLGFLDFSTLDKRRRACLQELRLNRRSAPALYLDVVAVGAPPSGVRVGAAVGEAVDYAVRMRRFDPAATLDRVAARGELTVELIDRLAQVVARLHAGADVAPAGFGSIERVRRIVDEAIAGIRERLQSASDRARVDALADWTAAEWRALAPQVDERAATGFVRECHGDLHLGNVVLLDGEPVPFDGIEFSDELRYIDVGADIAFTFMDLMDDRLPRLAWRFVGRYLEQTGDYAGLALLRAYAVYRALVRAEVALIRVHEPLVRRQVRLREHATFERYLALAEALRRSGLRVLVVMNGLSGSGKSTVALALAERLGGVRVRSDVERKRLFGFAPEDRTQQSIYTSDATLRTYERLAQSARAALAAGVPAVVDGAFLQRAERDRFRALAAGLGARFALVVCEAPVEALRARVAARYGQGRDASEADVAVLERQMRWQQRPAADEADRMRIDTGASWAAVEAQCERLAAELVRD